MKGIIISDSHLGLNTHGVDNPLTGLNTRTEDIFSRFDQVKDYAINNTVDIILHSGDVFNKKDVNQTVVNKFYEWCREINEAGIDIVILNGNHDGTRLNLNKNSLDIASTLRLPKMYFTRGGDFFDLGYLQVGTISYWTPPEEIENEIACIGRKVDWERPAVLLVHLQIDYPDSPGHFREALTTIPISTLTKLPWTTIFAGHIHKHRILNENPLLLYVGSLAPHSFNEEMDGAKGFIVFETEGNKISSMQLHPTKGLKLRTFRGNFLDIQAQLEAHKIEDFKNYIVRFIINESDGPIDGGYIKSKMEMAFKYIIKKEKIKTELRRIETTQTFNAEDYLKMYFEKDEQKDKLLVLAKEIMN